MIDAFEPVIHVSQLRAGDSKPECVLLSTAQHKVSDGSDVPAMGIGEDASLSAWETVVNAREHEDANRDSERAVKQQVKSETVPGET